MRRRAFTLIELLVVVAILSLLLAILLPSLRAARTQAKRAACANNVRQIASGWQMYIEDRGNRDRFPRLLNINVTYGGRQGTASTQYLGARPLNSYLGLPAVLGEATYDSTTGQIEVTSDKGGEVFQCPADTGWDRLVPTVYAAYGNSYQTNLALVGPLQLQIPAGEPVGPQIVEYNRMLPSMAYSKIDVVTSRVALLGDYDWYLAFVRGSNPLANWHEKPSYFNLAYLDGHVEFRRVRKGVYVSDGYSIFPVRTIADAAQLVQQEVPTE